MQLLTLMKDVISTKENYLSNEKCLQIQFCEPHVIQSSKFIKFTG